MSRGRGSLGRASLQKRLSVVSERWVSVPGYEGRYEVSSEGRVRSLGFVVRSRGRGRPYRPGRVLSPAVKVNGYLQVTLVGEDGGRKSCQVHQIVCSAFLGPCPPGKQVCHWDGDRENNHIENLRYGTAGDNAADRARHGNFVCNLPGIEWCSS